VECHGGGSCKKTSGNNPRICASGQGWAVDEIITTENPG
jgi:type III secretion system FlhB-like substrate exporter